MMEKRERIDENVGETESLTNLQSNFPSSLVGGSTSFLL